MRKKTTAQSLKDEVKSPEVAAPVVERNPPVAVETMATEPKKQVATVAAVKKVAAKPKAVAEKPAPKPKTPAKPVQKAPVSAKEKVAEAPKVEKAEKASKVKKPKLVRDSFTIPETDYVLFASLKQRALTAGVEVKKAEILRAALGALAKLDDAELAKAIGLVERIKTGRPKK
jgi:hypothetical protein